MTEPVAGRPRMFGRTASSTPMPWSWAEERLTRSANYWVATTRPDGRPHSRPVWGVWHEGALWFSTGSLAAGNLERSPEVTVHTESGDEAVIVEGVAEPVDDVERLRPVVDLYNAKYSWDLTPEAPPGPFYAVRPRVVFGWESDGTGTDKGEAFGASATRWRPA